MVKYLCVGLTLSLFFGSASSDVSNSQKGEVNHLLKYIRDTNCAIERNGKLHKGSEAVRHVKEKYDYYKNRIMTTEDFIKYAATKSLMSGRYYLVKCRNRSSIKTRDWLLQELSRVRGKS